MCPRSHSSNQLSQESRVSLTWSPDSHLWQRAPPHCENASWQTAHYDNKPYGFSYAFHIPGSTDLLVKDDQSNGTSCLKTKQNKIKKLINCNCSQGRSWSWQSRVANTVTEYFPHSRCGPTRCALMRLLRAIISLTTRPSTRRSPYTRSCAFLQKPLVHYHEVHPP